MASEAVDVRRDRLLDRIYRVQPKILVLLAPAGFGKSTLLRQLPLEGGPTAVCDCTDVRDDLDLARRLTDALAILRSDAQTEADRSLLGDGALTVAERLNRTLEEWRAPFPGTVVFENAEHFSEVPIAREFFARLFANRPAERRIVVCTRRPFRISLSKFAPPHEILVLRARELAFDLADVAALFTPYIGDADSIERIMTISEGWPVAVLLLRRFASEGRVAMLLDRLDDIAFAELHDYLQHEIVADFEPSLYRALFVCAALENPTPIDLRAAGIPDDQIDALSELAKQSPFLSRSADGRFGIHPLLGALLIENRGDRRIELLRTTAAYYERERNLPRAAELLMIAGDQADAALMLSGHEAIRDRTPATVYARLISRLDPVLVQRYPRLWGMTAIARLFTKPTQMLLDEAESLWRTLPLETSLQERYYIFVFRVLLMSYLGQLDAALDLLAGFMDVIQSTEAPDELLGAYLLYIRGILRARAGRISEGERDLHSSLPFLEERDVLASGTYLCLGADVARVRGERPIERQFIERALERVRRATLPNFMAFDYAEAFIGAWLAGDAEQAAQHAQKLDDYVERSRAHAFAFLAAAANGRSAEPEPADLSAYVAYGYMVALSNSTNDAERTTMARAAFEAARESHRPFIIALAAVAVALVDREKRDEYCAIAQEAAATCDAPALQEAVRAVAAERPSGMLDAFVAHVVSDRSNVVRPLVVHVSRAGVDVDGTPVAMTGRELELVLALSVRREPTSRLKLASMLWPDLDEAAALNALSVCLHRARAHLKRRDAIVRQGDGYALHPDALVDLWDIERAAASLRSKNSMSEGQRAALLDAWTALRNSRPASCERWEWFEPIERRLCELRIEIASRLAKDALANGDTKLALELAGDLIALDECDEGAREIAIRAHLAEGDRGAAMRQFRALRDTLLAELQCEPSKALADLVMS